MFNPPGPDSGGGNWKVCVDSSSLPAGLDAVGVGPVSTRGRMREGRNVSKAGRCLENKAGCDEHSGVSADRKSVR